MGAITIRIATDSDHEQITSLSARNPQEGILTLFVNRMPRFNSLHRILDPDAWHLVACEGEQVIGLVGIINFQANVLGEIHKTGYILDLRVDMPYRSGTTAYRLIKAAIDRIQETGVDMVVANFIKDNHRSLVFTKGRGKLPSAHCLGTNKIVSLLPLYRMKIDRRFEIGAPAEDDIPEILEIYRKYACGFKVSPVITKELFLNYLNSINGLSLDHFILAREDGKIKAVTALWDEHFYKAYQILRFTTAIKFANSVLRFLSLFFRVPRPIRSDEPLKQLSVVLFAHDDCPEALENLFRYANNRNLGSDYTLIMVYAQENDPVFRLLKRFKSVSVRTEMYLFAKDREIFNRLDENPDPVQFDLALVT